MNRSVYRHNELRPLLHPRSVAVVGASQRQGSYGLRVTTQLATLDAPIYPINPRYEEVAGRRAHPTVAAIPETPECAVILTNQELVEAAVRDCVDAGVPGVLIVTSGFAETRMPERAASQARLLDMVRGTKTKLLGPNCMGYSNYLNGVVISIGIMPARCPPRPAPIAIITQSGGLSATLANHLDQGGSVSHTISVGNASDVGIADLIAYMAEEPGCAAIACTFEGLANIDRFIEAAELARKADKPLIVYKMAVGQSGATAALSHTGSLAGTDAAWRAMFKRYGVISVPRLEDLMETAAFFAKAGHPTGHGVALASSSGGCVVMAADMAETHGVLLPRPGPAATEVLKRYVPEYGSIANPVDFTGTVATAPGGPEACADALLADPQYSTLIVTVTAATAAQAKRTEQYYGLPQKHDKILTAYWASVWADGPGAKDIEGQPRMALFRSLDRCFAALGQWHRREAVLRNPYATPAPLVAKSAKEEASRLLAGTRERVLTEREAKSALAPYGIPVVSERLTRSADECVAAAAELGFPVVLKVESADIPHKTEAGVIRLNLSDAQAVREGYAAVMDKALAAVRPERIAGVLVQPMVPAGLELTAGVRVDPIFGPLVMVGLGGIFVEVLADTAVGLAPITRAEALGMLAGLKGAKLLDGFRGGPAVDRERLADILCRLGEFAADHRETLAEIDINPLICSGTRILAVDALIVKRG